MELSDEFYTETTKFLNLLLPESKIFFRQLPEDTRIRIREKDLVNFNDI